MIRNVVMVRLRPDADRDEVAAIQRGLLGLRLPGTVSYAIGDDLALRVDNWSFAIVADFATADAYRDYDLDREHNDLRARLRPLAEQVARVQFELPAN